jgi:hypothetical protein
MVTVDTKNHLLTANPWYDRTTKTYIGIPTLKKEDMTFTSSQIIFDYKNDKYKSPEQPVYINLMDSKVIKANSY